MSYEITRERLETYFDRTASRAWEALTSDAPVSRIRQTVRAGRDAMRSEILSRLPEDLRGARVLDAGCGTGQMAEVLARRGADVVAADLSPSLIDVSRRRITGSERFRITYRVGDMLSPELGRFDYVVAMDSLIHYAGADIALAVDNLASRADGHVVFTVAPKTLLLTMMWWAGQVAPRRDRSPAIRPHRVAALQRMLHDFGSGVTLTKGRRVSRGFYISQAVEARA